MRPATDAFAAALTESHTIATRIELLSGGSIVDTIDETIDGTVTLDGRAALRGRCDLTIVDDGTLGLIPTAPTDTLAPYGNEVRVYRGIKFPDDTTELISLGIFRIESVNVEETGGSGITLRVSGIDRSARAADARFEYPTSVTAGTNYADAISDLLQVPFANDLDMDFTATTRTTPQLIAEEGDDRWAFVQSMASAIGMVLYFDGDGVCVLRPASTGTTAVATLSEGDDGVLLSASRDWNREGAYNRVIATGENTGETAPVRGVATDENPSSPTYYFGPFGPVPRFYASPFLTTDDQAADAAEAILSKELGTTQEIGFGTVVDPRLEPDDVVRISRAVTGLDEDHTIDSLTIPLSSTGVLAGRTRAQVVS